MRDVLDHRRAQLLDPLQGGGHLVERGREAPELGIGGIGDSRTKIPLGDRPRGLGKAIEWLQDPSQQPPRGERAERHADQRSHDEHARNVGVEHRLRL